MAISPWSACRPGPEILHVLAENKQMASCFEMSEPALLNKFGDGLPSRRVQHDWGNRGATFTGAG